ncbi:hypothetical protein ACOSQ2_018250 [Xanthoceras sorbifolium]
MSNSGDHPHVVLLPSAGMGHLIPFLRLAASLVHKHCRLTLITTHPTVSLAESQFISSFLSAFPDQVTEKQFHLLPFDPTSANSDDPFLLRWEAIGRSAYLLAPLLSSISPISAFVSDVTLFSSVFPLTTNLGVRNYILFTSSARMYSLFRSFPTFAASKTRSGSVPFGNNVVEMSLSSIPPPLLNLNNLFAKMFLQNALDAMKSNGILINTFEALEGDMLHALSNGTRDGFPPLYAVGPFLPCEFEKSERNNAPLKWLDNQPEGSVVYVSFGSRTALSREQMKELGTGLVRSRCRFLWIVKDKTVDKEDGESLDKLIGNELMEKIQDQGLVIKDWVDQDEILSHKAVGGFVSHGGWNSMVEAAWHGVRVLVWPQAGDQKINAEAVERSGLGMWVQSWGWADQQMVVVKAEEIGHTIKNMMENDHLRVKAAKIKEEARKAVVVGGTSESTMMGLIQDWKKNNIHLKNM